MNVTHVKLPDGFMEGIGDKLDFLLETQRNAESHYNEIEENHGHRMPEWPIDINNRHDQQFFKDGVYRLIEELGEATNCLRNRPHSQTEYVTDEQHFLEEFAGDALHYFLRLFVMLGMSSEDIVKCYFAKSKVNEFRRESVY